MVINPEAMRTSPWRPRLFFCAPAVLVLCAPLLLWGGEAEAQVHSPAQGGGPASSSPEMIPANSPHLANGLLRFGGGGHNMEDFTPSPSVLANGMLAQPFYWNSLLGRWYRLTATGEGLSITLSSGAGGSHWTGSHFPTGGAFDSGTLGLQALDNLAIETVREGVLRVSGELSLDGQAIRLTHEYSLDPEDAILRVFTRVTSLGDTPLPNLHVWVGAADDWVGSSDTPQKERGNLVDGSFQRITRREDPASALMLSTGADAVLLFSPSPGAGVIHERCCSFANSYLAPPENAFPEAAGDGSYALHLPMGAVAPGESAEVIWFYAAGSGRDIAAVVQGVAAAAVVR